MIRFVWIGAVHLRATQRGGFFHAWKVRARETKQQGLQRHRARTETKSAPRKPTMLDMRQTHQLDSAPQRTRRIHLRPRCSSRKRWENARDRKTGTPILQLTARKQKHDSTATGNRPHLPRMVGAGTPPPPSGHPRRIVPDPSPKFRFGLLLALVESRKVLLWLGLSLHAALSPPISAISAKVNRLMRRVRRRAGSRRMTAWRRSVRLQPVRCVMP